MEKGENKFWRSMLQLSLLQGLSEQDVLQIAEHVRLNFRTISHGQNIVLQGEQCKNLVCILNGTVVAECKSDEGHYKLREWCQAPTILEPRALFGLNRAYERSYIAEGEVQILEIEQGAVRDTLLLYPTFRINLFNTLCFSHYKMERLRWKSYPNAIENRFIAFLHARILHPAGKKELMIRMTDLAKELDTTRLNVSHLLHSLAQNKILKTTRGKIIVPHYELLMTHRQTP